MEPEVWNTVRYGSVASQLSSLQFYRVSRSGSRVSIPVRPSQTVYAQYRHISGTPASSSQRAVPLSRVALLNSLITNLQRLQKEPSYSPDTESSEKKSEALIEQYAAELHRAVQSMGSSAGAGMIFSLSA